jgi:predicted signal transduction protein with EAL and GGDEF domain
MTSARPVWRTDCDALRIAIIANADQTIRCLQQWKALGVRIAVNHFGTDYSSLSYLAKLRVDRLKLDKSLIHNVALRNSWATCPRRRIGSAARARKCRRRRTRHARERSTRSLL